MRVSSQRCALSWLTFCFSSLLNLFDRTLFSSQIKSISIPDGWSYELFTASCVYSNKTICFVQHKSVMAGRNDKCISVSGGSDERSIAVKAAEKLGSENDRKSFCSEQSLDCREKKKSPQLRRGERPKGIVLNQEVKVHSQKRHSFAATCSFYQYDLLTCNKFVKIRPEATRYFQTCCDLMKYFAASLSVSVLIRLIQQLAADLLKASMLMQVAKIKLAASCYVQSCCKLTKQAAAYNTV